MVWLSMHTKINCACNICALKQLGPLSALNSYYMYMYFWSHKYTCTRYIDLHNKYCSTKSSAQNNDTAPPHHKSNYKQTLTTSLPLTTNITNIMPHTRRAFCTKCFHNYYFCTLVSWRGWHCACESFDCRSSKTPLHHQVEGRRIHSYQ